MKKRFLALALALLLSVSMISGAMRFRPVMAEDETEPAGTETVGETVPGEGSGETGNDEQIGEPAGENAGENAGEAEAETEAREPVVTPTDNLDEVTRAGAVCTLNGVEYDDLAAAITAASGASTIVLIDDIEAVRNTGFTIPAGKNITLDLNGHDLVVSAPVATTSAGIKNNGTLTINDSAGGGKIEFNADHIDSQTIPSFASNTITNSGTLTVNGGTIINKCTGGGACFALDNNSSGGAVSATINGGEFISNATAIRMFCNSTTKDNNLTINGGYINGAEGIWLQLPNTNPDKANLVINGGTIDGRYDAVYAGDGAYVQDASGNYVSVDTNCSQVQVTITGGDFKNDVGFFRSMPGENIEVSGGLFEGEYGVYSENEDTVPFITGGTFLGDKALNEDEDAGAAAFIKPGYNPNPINEEGDYYVGIVVNVTVTIDPKEKFEGEDDPELTYTLSNEAARDFVTVTLTREAGETPGTYKITATVENGSNDDLNPGEYYKLTVAGPADFVIKSLYIEREMNSGDVTVNGDKIHMDAVLVVEDTDAATTEQLKNHNKLKNTDVILTKEVHFELAGDIVEFKGSIDVTFEVGEDYNGKTAVILHKKPDGKFEYWSKKVENGKVTVTVENLSPFGIGISKTSSGSTSGGSAKTGDSAVMAMGALQLMTIAAFVCAWILLRRRSTQLAYEGVCAADADDFDDDIVYDAVLDADEIDDGFDDLDLD